MFYRSDCLLSDLSWNSIADVFVIYILYIHDIFAIDVARVCYGLLLYN